MKLKQLTLTLLLLVSSIMYSQIYVDVNNTSGTENGTSWATAYTDLQTNFELIFTKIKRIHPSIVLFRSSWSFPSWTLIQIS